jgi:hypothetical protein
LGVSMSRLPIGIVTSLIDRVLYDPPTDHKEN